MADLCLRQGHRDKALGIYRRLIARTSDEVARNRIRHRVAAIEGEPATATTPGNGAGNDAPLPIPGVRTRTSGDEVTLEWRLPPETRAPTLEVLLVKQGPGGVETETRSLAVDGATGRLMLTVMGLQLARAAAGTRGDGRFVPFARG